MFSMVGRGGAEGSMVVEEKKWTSRKGVRDISCSSLTVGKRVVDVSMSVSTVQSGKAESFVAYCFGQERRSGPSKDKGNIF